MKYLAIIIFCSFYMIAYAQESFIFKANYLLNEEKYNEAIELYSKVLEYDSTNIDALFNRGYSYRRLGKDEEALKDYNKVKFIYPQYALVYYNVGNLLFDQEKYDLAIANYSVSSQLDTNHAQSVLMTGLAYEMIEMYDSALHYLSLTIRLFPEYDLGYSNRGNLYRRMEETELAIVDLQKSFLLNPKDKTTINNLVLVIQRKEYKFQIKFIESNIPVQYRTEDVYIQLSFAFLMMKKYKKSIEVCDKGINLYPNSDVLFNNRGFCKLNLKRYSEAVLNLKISDSLNSNDALTLNNLGFSYFKLGEVEQGMKFINKSIEINDSNSYAYRNRAIINLAVGNKVDACFDLKKAKELGYSDTYGNDVEKMIKKHCKKE